MSNYYGIDYGRGETNIDHSTGIRFGVIPYNELGGYDLEDAFVPDYGNPTCPKCGNPVSDDNENCKKDYYCRNCKDSFWNYDCFPDEAYGFYLEQDGYLATSSGGDNDIFIEKSPYFTYAQFCSPCAPGACYLMNPVDSNGPKAYCFGHDWFEDGKAPYPVYRVDTGELVNP